MKVQRRILIQRNVIMFIYSRKIWVISVGHPSPSSYYFYAQSPWLKCLIMVLLILKYLSFSYSSYVCLMLFRFLKFDCVCVITLCFKTDARQVLCVDYIIYIFSLLHYFCHGKYVWTRKHVARLKKRLFFIIVYGINVQE